MSMKDLFPSKIPSETARIVEPLLDEDSVYYLVGYSVSDYISDEQFAELYALEGRPGINPVVLSLVTIFQYLEKLPDRAAAQMAKLRLDWKYALRQELDWSGFHYSDLCNFRKRLLNHGQEWMLFEGVLNYLREQGLVKAGARQRTDATHIVGAIKQMSDAEVVREAVRLAIRALMSTDAKWVMQHIPMSFIRSYKKSWPGQRMGQTEIEELMQQTAEESRWLLDHLALLAVSSLQQLPEIQQLAQIWDEQYQYVNEPESLVSVKRGKDYQVNRIRNPHDPEATYGSKADGAKTWIGYKLHITETIVEPRFITDVTLTGASTRDVTDLAAIQDNLIERGLIPACHYVDQGYMSGENIARSEQKEINLRGRVGPDTQGKPVGFRLEDFQIDLETQTAICPLGRKQRRWVPTTGNTDNRVAVHIFFGKQCLACPFYGPGRCTNSKTGRHLGLSPFHPDIQARRREEQTDEFLLEMHSRAAIEGTISEVVRAHGLRRTRYRGRAKTRLQMLSIAAATNLKRLARHIAYSTDKPAARPLS